MPRSFLPGHRRYSITHRAVQRLRELAPTLAEEDDETLRDKLDAAAGKAEDEGKTIRTLDALLGEPQVLLPVESFGDQLYAIVKDDTVVTVLPRGHGEEIVARGKALEQRFANGDMQLGRGYVERGGDRWDEGPRRWRRHYADPAPVQYLTRGTTPTGVRPFGRPEGESPVNGGTEIRPEQRALVVLPPRPEPESVVAKAMRRGLDAARRRASVLTLREAFILQTRESPLLPLWNALAAEGAPYVMQVGDLIDAVRSIDDPSVIDGIGTEIEQDFVEEAKPVRHVIREHATLASSLPYDEAVLQTVMDAGEPIAAEKIRAKLGGSPAQLRAVLKDLISSRKIRRIGEKRAARYELVGEA